MNLAIAVYEDRSVGTDLHWVTLALGPHTIVRQGRSVMKLQRRLTDELKKKIRTLTPKDMVWFEFPTGVRLVRLHLELSLRGGGKRLSVSGKFPVIVEPRFINDDDRRQRIYHPKRPLEWAWIDPEKLFGDQVAELFQTSWGRLSKEEVEKLQTRGKDGIRRVAFSAQARSPIDDLESAPGIWDDLDVDPLARKKKKKRPRRKVLTELPRLAQDETALVLEEGYDLGVPREPYRSALQLALSGSRKRSAVVLGPSGVGKTTALRRLAHDLALADGYKADRNLDTIHHVWRLSGRRIIAGMTHLGDWEERCVQLIEEARTHPVILWFDDIHAFARIGRSKQSERNLAEFFRGPVARGEVVLVAESTPERFQRLELEAPSFAESMLKIVMSPSNPKETLGLMFREARNLERRYQAAIAPRAFKTVLDLGSALFPETALPGTAVRLLREVVQSDRGSMTEVLRHLKAGQKIQAIKAYRKQTRVGLREAKEAVERMTETADSRSPPRQEVGETEVLRLIARKTGLPLELLQLDQPFAPADVARTFRRYVIGQDAGVRAAQDLFVRIRAGLTAPGRPYAVYLLTGPTGTGKTELAKSIAEALYGDRRRLLRFDMSELSGPDAVARLIGDDLDPRGLLTESVRQEPFSVVLFDEVEKAHPSVLQLMLQLFDEGRLSDAAGDTANFTHAVVLLTSNLGARNTSPVGFGREGSGATEAMLSAVREFFPPELFNRIDRVVPFRPLGREAALQIARKELRQLLGRRGLIARRIWATPTRSVVAKVVEEGFSPEFGARPVKRYLEDHVATLITDHLTEAPRASMRLLRIYVRDGRFAIHTESLVEAEPTPGGYLLAGGAHDLSREELIERIKEESLFLFDDSDEGTLATIGAEVSRRMAQGQTDALYELELARSALEELRQRIQDLRRSGPHRGVRRATSIPDPRSRSRSMPTRTVLRGEAIELLSELFFLRRVLGNATDGDRHAVFIELLRVGEASSERRTVVDQEGLMSWLLAVYGTARGECEEVAARRRGEAPLQVDAEPREALRRLRTDRPDHVVLRVMGLSVVDFFESENGCHVWESLTHGTEVLRVRAFPAGPNQRAQDVLQDHLDRRRAFDAALEAGAELPTNPEALLPTVRSIRFDPPRDPTRPASLTVEDFGLFETRTAEVRSPVELIGELLRLRMTLAPDRPSAPENADG
ncbi:MAG: AAA family ATPase [Myxococcota bacterium]